MDERCKAIWEKLSAALKPQVSADTFKRWFSAVELTKATEDELTFVVPNNIYQFWIESNHMTALQSAITNAVGAPRTVRFLTSDESDDDNDFPAPEVRKTDGSSHSKTVGLGLNLNPRNTCESFVIGPNNQIVLSSDRPASEIANLEHRLVSRFEWGLTAELQPPDIETRLAILRKKARALQIKLHDDVYQFLATRIRSNVRRLEGALMRVASFASLSGKELTQETIEHLLKDILLEERRQTVTIEQIQRKVAEHFDVRLADMTSKRRPASIAFPRQVAMYLARELTKASLNEIGDAFGGRDHGTVLHACKLVKKRMKEQDNIRQTISFIDSALQR